MLSARLIDLIHTHAEQLAREVLKDLATNPRTRHWNVVPGEELEHRISRMYQNLGSWIGDPKGDAIRVEYEDWGRRRYRSGIPLSEIVYAVLLLKQHLRKYIAEHGLTDYSGGRHAPQEMLPVHMYGIQELTGLVGDFFDKALYHLARGYEMESQAARNPRSG